MEYTFLSYISDETLANSMSRLLKELPSSFYPTINKTLELGAERMNAQLEAIEQITGVLYANVP